MFVFSFAGQPLKSIIKKVDKPKVPKKNVSNITEMLAKTRGFEIRLDKLDLTSLKFCQSNPNIILLPKRNEIPTLTFCEGCAGSFDAIFETQRKAVVKPYENTLELALKRNEALAKELADIEQQWHDESNKWYQLSNQVDRITDKYDKMFETNQTLKSLVLHHYHNMVVPEHNYA